MTHWGLDADSKKTVEWSLLNRDRISFRGRWEKTCEKEHTNGKNFHLYTSVRALWGLAVWPPGTPKAIHSPMTSHVPSHERAAEKAP